MNSEEKAEADISLAFLEAQADVYAEKLGLPQLIKDLTSPMNLDKNAPDEVRKQFRARMESQIYAMFLQSFIEGAVRAHGNDWTYF